MTTRTRIAPLSPREEVTLRRVALGYAERSELPPAPVRRLVELGLADDIDGVLALTADGQQRYEQLTRPSALIGQEMPDELEQLMNMLIANRRR